MFWSTFQVNFEKDGYFFRFFLEAGETKTEYKTVISL